jgi:hypothetical protein
LIATPDTGTTAAFFIAGDLRAAPRDPALRADFLAGFRDDFLAGRRASCFRFFAVRLADFLARFAITRLPSPTLQQARGRGKHAPFQRSHRHLVSGRVLSGNDAAATRH